MAIATSTHIRCTWLHCLFPCRRVPLPHHDHARFSFLAPPELTSLQVNVPVYELPELPQPDRPPAQPRAPDLVIPLLVRL
jgi:hypothetical protein